MRSSRRALLVSLTFLAALAGARAATLPDEQCRFDLVQSVVLSFVVTWLCTVDSRLLGKPLVHSQRWLMLGTWPVSAPIYVLWTRKWRGVLLLLALLAGWILANIGGAALAIALLSMQGVPAS